MRNVLIRLSVAISMELMLALVGAPFYMQVFPVTMFVWAIYDIAMHTKIVKIQTPLDLPDDLKKQLEKHAKKQMKNIEKRLRTGEDTKTKTKDRDGLK
ncbi:hypothetical protein FWF93_01810 [Candidatus Saccharibacteria bacterium]|nr:hypothetical protein [Candidatus Saccharibacteria bacterium]